MAPSKLLITQYGLMCVVLYQILIFIFEVFGTLVIRQRYVLRVIQLLLWSLWFAELTNMDN